MATVPLKREVYADQEFDLAAACVQCGRAVRRDERGRRVRPVLAIATADTGYDFARAVTLCSACLDSDGLDACQLAALGRIEDIEVDDAMRCRYQLLGTPEQREMLAEFVEMVFWSVAE